MAMNENEPVACLVGMKGGAFDTPTTKRAYTYAHQPNNGPASRLGDACLKAMTGTAGDSIDRGLLLLKALQDAGFGVFDLGAEYTRPEDHSGLIKRIDAAIERVTKGWGLMTIPADPRSDVDLVLSECKALLEGENPPFWATQFHPVQPEKKMLVCCPQCKLVFDGKSNRLNSEAQPVAKNKPNEYVCDGDKHIQGMAPCPHCKPEPQPDFKPAFMEWHDKTEWVQERRDWPFPTLGMHRADVMKKYIAHLEAQIQTQPVQPAVNDQLLAALRFGLKALEWADNGMVEGQPIQKNTQQAIILIQAAIAAAAKGQA